MITILSSTARERSRIQQPSNTVEWLDTILLGTHLGILALVSRHPTERACGAPLNVPTKICRPCSQPAQTCKWSSWPEVGVLSDTEGLSRVGHLLMQAIASAVSSVLVSLVISKGMWLDQTLVSGGPHLASHTCTSGLLTHTPNFPYPFLYRFPAGTVQQSVINLSRFPVSFKTQWKSTVANSL